MTGNVLDPSADEIRRLGGEAVEWVARYAAEVRDLPIYPPAPHELVDKIERALAEPLPQEGRDVAQLLATFRDVIVPGSRHNGHPRFFGYVSAPGAAVASIADLLASALNANLTSWRSAPAPTRLEHLTIDWIRQALGCPPGTGGLFLSGGSMANLTALAAARYRHCGERLAAEGATRAIPARLRVYASEEVHHSIDKAAALLGIGHANVRRIAVDSMFRMDVVDLERQIDEDRVAGHEPFCVVASAGTVVTGAVDPLETSPGRSPRRPLDARRRLLRRLRAPGGVGASRSSTVWRRPTRSPSIPTSGSTCRPIAAASCTGTRRR